MRPDRSAEINGHQVHEYYWTGFYVVYVDNLLQEGKSFERVCEELRNEQTEEPLMPESGGA